MKKRIVALALMLLLILAVGPAMSAANIISVCLDGRYLSFDVSPVMENNRVYVPMRAIFEALGAEVEWQATENKIIATKGDTEIILTVGSTRAHINGVESGLDAAPIVIGGRTLVPLRFVSQALDYPVEWDGSVSTVFIGQRPERPPYTIRSETINGRFVNIVEIAPGALTPSIYVANNRIASHQNMEQMVEATGAIIAINGTFFEAYGSDGYYEPNGTLIKDGKLIHRGSVGTTIGFTSDGKVLMDALDIRIEGGVNGSWGWPNNWYAYGLNHRPGENGVFIYTREWGSAVGLSRGVSVAVTNGVVTSVVRDSDIAIPANGYVINICGTEINQLGSRFKVGDTVDYRIIYGNTAFSSAVTAVGAGPRLVKDGAAFYNPTGEGFTSTRILNDSASRSAIGVKSDGTIVLVTTSATVSQLSEIMHSLGCVQAMNLDGGASSGLYVQGRFITRPGRNLSNILYFK